MMSPLLDPMLPLLSRALLLYMMYSVCITKAHNISLRTAEQVLNDFKWRQ